MTGNDQILRDIEHARMTFADLEQIKKAVQLRLQNGDYDEEPSARFPSIAIMSNTALPHGKVNSPVNDRPQENLKASFTRPFADTDLTSMGPYR